MNKYKKAYSLFLLLENKKNKCTCEPLRLIMNWLTELVSQIGSDTLFTADLNALVDEMISRGHDGKFLCLSCDKAFLGKQAAERHAEIHLNMTHLCIVCQRTFKTRNALATHYTRQHPDEVVSPWTMK